MFVWLSVLPQANLKKLWPQFPGNKEPVAGSIVSDSIQHAFLIGCPTRLTQPRKVDPSLDAPRVGVDARYALVVPNVGEDFAFDVFQFVKTVDHTAAIQHVDGFSDGKRFRIKEANPMAPIG